MVITETWVTCTRSPRYEVSDQGRVRAVSTQRPGILTPALNRKGYPYVAVERRRLYVHTLVLEAFVGPCPAGLEARHLDDLKTNNAVGNLTWGTSSENTRDSIRNGTHYFSRANRG